jgi:hypothetical protein
MRGFRPLTYFTTRDVQRLGTPTRRLRRTFVKSLCFIIQDYAREVNRFQRVPSLGVSRPIFPVKEYSIVDGLQECRSDSLPMCGILVTHHGRTVVRWGFNILTVICNLPQRRECLRCMLKIAVGEVFYFCFDTRANLLSRRIPHPAERQLFDVQVPDLAVSTPLVSKESISMASSTHWDANLLNDSSTMSHCANPQRMQFSARLFNAGTSYCNSGLSGVECARSIYRLYLQGGR